MPIEMEIDLPDRFWRSRAETAEAEVERLKALLKEAADRLDMAAGLSGSPSVYGPILDTMRKARAAID